MSQTATPLNGQQQDQIKSWLNEKQLMRCKACNLGNVAPPTVIITLGGEKGPSENNVFMVPLSCGFCGNTILLDARTMGLIR